MAGAQPEEGQPAQDDGPRRKAVDGDWTLEITHAVMDAAMSAGDAISLGLAGGWLARYRDTWWVLYEIGWLRITDEAIAAEIDHIASRLAEVADDAGGDASAYGADPRSPDEGVER